jgi:hypothetical protein
VGHYGRRQCPQRVDPQIAGRRGLDAINLGHGQAGASGEFRAIPPRRIRSSITADAIRCRTSVDMAQGR